MKHVLVIAALLLGFSIAHAEKNGPCAQIKKACETAGFVKGQAKEGTGLWVDCIKPIMEGTAQPAKAIKALPAVDSSIVNDCKVKHPKFGQGKQK